MVDRAASCGGSSLYGTGYKCIRSQDQATVDNSLCQNTVGDTSLAIWEANGNSGSCTDTNACMGACDASTLGQSIYLGDPPSLAYPCLCAQGTPANLQYGYNYQATYTWTCGSNNTPCWAIVNVNAGSGGSGGASGSGGSSGGEGDDTGGKADSNGQQGSGAGDTDGSSGGSTGGSDSGGQQGGNQ